MKVKVGDKLPDAKVFLLEKDLKEVSIKKIINGEKTILFGLPGAFTPTCSEKHLPSFINASEEIKKNGIKKVICISINDPYVMDAWGKNQNLEKSIKEFSGKNFSDFKSILAELVAEKISPISKEIIKLLENKDYIDKILREGA